MSHTKKIDLGRSLNSIEITPLNPNDKHYPHLHLDEVEDERIGNLEVGKKGTAEIHFKVISKNKREDQHDGKRHSVTLEILSIEPGHDPKFDKQKTHWERFHP